jgi:N-acetyl-alpha-D-muramate 1-phosphate uridylyltransferase
MLPVAILAGGLATRLRPFTEHVPKSLIDVAGRPFADHQIEWLSAQGASRIVFLVGYKGELIRDALGDGTRWGLTLQYVFDGELLLGTGGALKRALPALGGEFIVMYGDSYLECDLPAVEAAYRTSGAPALMTVYRNDDRWDLSNVLFDSGRILRYDKRHRTPEMRHIDYGLGIMSAAALEPYPPDSPFDLALVYQTLVNEARLAAYEVTSRFYEIGSPQGLEETRAYLASRESRSNRDRTDIPGRT